MNLNEKRYCIYGTGGFGREVLTCLVDIYATTNYRVEEIAVFMVADEYYAESNIMGLPVIKLRFRLFKRQVLIFKKRSKSS